MMNDDKISLSKHIKSIVVLIGSFLLVYILPLGVRPLVIPDEFRYAEIPREMLASGDWVVPHLNGLRYLEKPVLGYWLNALAMRLFGENNFALRFPSALSVGISSLLIFVLMRRFADNYSTVAPLAAAVFLSCLEVFGVGTFNVLDSVFSMFLTAGLVSFFFSYMQDDAYWRKTFLAGFGASCALAFLTKGFLALTISALVIIPFMLWEGRWRELFRDVWLPGIIAVLFALPWSLMIHLRAPQFWHYFFWVEHIKRFFSDQAQHARPFWYFIVIMAVGAMPWTGLLPAVITGLKGKVLQTPLVRFAICWIFFPFLFLSASSGKISTYILPCYPAFAILTVVGLLNYLGKGRKRLYNTGSFLLAMVLTLAWVGLILNQIMGFPGYRLFGPVESGKCIITVAGLLIWSIMILLSIRSQNYQRKLALFCLAPVLLMSCYHFVIPDRSRHSKTPEPLLSRYIYSIGSDNILVADKYLVLAAAWIYKRDDIYLLGEGGELQWGLIHDQARHRLLSVNQFRKLVMKELDKKHLFLVTTTKRYTKWKKNLPEPVSFDSFGRFVLIQY